MNNKKKLIDINNLKSLNINKKNLYFNNKKNMKNEISEEELKKYYSKMNELYFNC